MEQMERICSRTIDELGRIVLPSELRARYGWGTGDILSLYYVSKGTLMLQLSEKNPSLPRSFSIASRRDRRN